MSKQEGKDSDLSEIKEIKPTPKKLAEYQRSNPATGDVDKDFRKELFANDDDDDNKPTDMDEAKSKWKTGNQGMKEAIGRVQTQNNPSESQRDLETAFGINDRVEERKQGGGVLEFFGLAGGRRRRRTRRKKRRKSRRRKKSRRKKRRKSRRRKKSRRRRSRRRRR